MAWLWGALMPHPPVIVPEVGRGREQEAAKTLEGLDALTSRLAGRKPDRLLLLSPHQPYAPGALCINGASRYKGSLAPFGAPGIDIRCSSFSSDSLAARLREAGIQVALGTDEKVTKDHGSVVPLYLLSRCWGGLPPTLIASPIGLSTEAAFALGKALAGYEDGNRWALLASGDLSHCLTPDAPAGFAPEGEAHDRAVVEALKQGDPSLLLELPAQVCSEAKECGLRSVLALMGLCGAPLEVFSYEAPFGVGYCTALGLLPAESKPVDRPESINLIVTPIQKTDPPSANMPTADGSMTPQPAGQTPHSPTGVEGGSPLPALARETLKEYLATGSVDEVSRRSASLENASWDIPGACFVSIKKKDGSLRGCIGTILPTRPSLREEVIGNAVSAAARDPRFSPMRPEELPDVDISVDVLSVPETIQSLEELDPAVYGVIVSKGGRRGLLLPDLEGVDSVVKQLAIAAQKGGIADLSGAEIQRFTVRRYAEKG